MNIKSTSKFCGYLALLYVLCATFGVATVSAHPGYYGTAFHAHTIEQAKEIAQKEHKLIFVHAGDNDRGWRHFRWPKAETGTLIDLLVREAVIVEVNLIKEQHEVARFNIDTPTLLILDQRGELIEQLDGNSVAPKVQHVLKGLVSSPEGLARIQLAIDSGHNSDFNHERYAAALAMAGKTAEAIKAYDKCLSSAIEEVSPAATSRRQYIIGALQSLSEADPKATRVLQQNRQKAAQKLKREPGNGVLAADIAQIDVHTGRATDSMALFNQLPKDSRARAGLFDYVSESLTQEKRYQELLALVEPITAIEGEITLYERNRILKPASAEQQTLRGTRRFVINRSINIIEALAGTHQDENCQVAIDKLLDFDATRATQASINAALARAGRSDISL